MEFTVIKKGVNEVVMTEGGSDPFIYLIKSGRCNVVRTSGQKTIRLGELGPGDFVGEMSHLGSSQVHSASVITTTETELILIDADRFIEALSQKPIWLKALLKDMARKIESLNNQLESAKKGY